MTTKFEGRGPGKSGWSHELSIYWKPIDAETLEEAIEVVRGGTRLDSGRVVGIFYADDKWSADPLAIVLNSIVYYPEEKKHKRSRK